MDLTSACTRTNRSARIKGEQGIQGIVGATGATGPQGPTGSGLKILGTYNTMEELERMHPVAQDTDKAGTVNIYTKRMIPVILKYQII